MRKLIIAILLLISFGSQAQIINASAPYRVTAIATPLLPIDSLIASTPQSVYSMQKLVYAYAGNCLKVKRSSDNTELDIGWSGNYVDTSAIKSFISSDNATVTIWYDQTANGRNLTPVTNAPKIATAGALIYQSGDLCIEQTDKTYAMKTANYQAYPDSIVLNGVYKVKTDGSYNVSATKTSTNQATPIDGYGTTYLVGNGTSFTNRSLSQNFNVAQGQVAWTFKASTPATTGLMQHWKNATSSLNSTTSYYNDANCPVIIGSRGDNFTGTAIYVFEVTTFSAMSAANLTQLLNSQIARYGL